MKKVVLFFSAGLGDAVLLVPLVNLLKREGCSVSGIFTSEVPCEALFEGSGLLDEIILAKSKSRMAWLALSKYRMFDLAIVNYFAANKSNLLVAQKLATMVHTNRIPDNAGKKLSSSLVYFEPKKDIQDAEQNLLLAGKGFIPLSEDLLQIPVKPGPYPGLPSNYIALQLSAGNNVHTYKNWPLQHWITFLKSCAIEFPALRFVLLGDPNEIRLAEEVMKANTGNVIPLAGKTNVAEAFSVLEGSAAFLGLDGGLMHMSVLLGKPTLSLWGPSSPDLYSYRKLNPDKFKVISLTLSCSPCSAWISPNTSRVRNVEDCPDRKCLRDLQPEEVFAEFSTFVKQHAFV